MPETKPAPVDVRTSDAPAPAGFSRSTKIGVIVAVVLIVLAECLVAYSYLPSASETEALASASLKTATPAPAAKEEPKEASKEGHKEAAKPGDKQQQKDGTPSASDLVEVDLGAFTVTAVQPTANSTLRIAFHLYGTVAALDQAKFNARMKETQHRFREQVIVTLRSAEVSDLTDAGLGLLKRTILEKTNITLGEPLLKMIIFSEFSFMEV
jgi:flagellar FliL protein